MDAEERYLFDLRGFIVVKQVLSHDEVAELNSLLDSYDLWRKAEAGGEKALFNDPELMPLKGQLTVLVPQAEVTYSTSGAAKPLPPGAGFIHMMPRTDGIILGGTSLRDDWTTTVDEAQRQRIVDTHIELFNAMRSTTRT